MEKWEVALDKFLNKWQDTKEVQAAIVTGSYVLGTATPSSDIDVQIVLADSVTWRERGNEIVDGILFEYFANPPKSIRGYFMEDFKNGRRAAARMFATGKIVFDKTGIGKTLQEEGKKELKKVFDKPAFTRIEPNKYHIWEMLDGIKDSEGSKDFRFQYYLLLDEIWRSYTNFLGAEMVAPSKMYKMLNSNDFRSKYQIDSLPDSRFIGLMNKALEVENTPNIEELANYTLIQMGGFKIDGWKFRTPAE